MSATPAAKIGTHFTLCAMGALADGRYASYPAGPCPIELTGSSTAQCNLSGKSLPGLPKWSGSLGSEYTQAIHGGELYVRADVNSKTKVFGDATDSAYTVLRGYNLVNASFGFRAVRGWEVANFYAQFAGPKLPAKRHRPVW
jgi:iron complex outermembrane receptor protein